MRRKQDLILFLFRSEVEGFIGAWEDDWAFSSCGRQLCRPKQDQNYDTLLNVDCGCVLCQESNYFFCD